MAIISNETMQAVNTELERKNRILLSFAHKYASTAWEDILINVRGGVASENYVIGDEFPCQYSHNNADYDFPWIVVDIDREVEWEDGTKHPGLVLMSKYATIESIQFDSQEDTVVDLTTEPTALEGWYYWGVNGSTWTPLELETGATIPTTYSSVHKCGFNQKNIAQSGYNRWSHSGIRQWLNSDSGKNMWWEPMHTGDKAPSQLPNVDGFMRGLPNDFLNVLTPVKVKTVCNNVTDGGIVDTTLDTFYLPSLEELYGIGDTAVEEGPYFEYWKRATELDAPSNANNNARISKKADSIDGNAEVCSIRSLKKTSVYGAYSIGRNGQLYGFQSNGDVYIAHCQRPVCVIS